MRTKAAASSSRAQLSLSFPLFLFFLKSRRRKKAAAAPPPRPLPQQSWPRNVNYFQTTENYDCCSSDVCSVRPASPARRRARRDICFQHSLVLSLARRGRSLHNVSSSLTVLPLRGRGRERERGQRSRLAINANSWNVSRKRRAENITPESRVLLLIASQANSSPRRASGHRSSFGRRNEKSCSNPFLKRNVK